MNSYRTKTMKPRELGRCEMCLHVICDSQPRGKWIKHGLCRDCWMQLPSVRALHSAIEHAKCEHCGGVGNVRCRIADDDMIDVRTTCPVCGGCGRG